jgi:phosphoribosylanthranilate isomerase
MPTRIKICGITRAEDALRAAELGADAIGLVFAAGSPRRIGHHQAGVIVRQLPPFVSVVALFMDSTAADVAAVIETVRPGILQFHGSETAGFCADFGLPYIKAFPMGEGSRPARFADYPAAAGLLLDGHRAGEQGGTGRSFEWMNHRELPKRPIILAGGLHPDNVATAIGVVRPYAVDVSSGVESSPGIKDHALMAAFIESVKRADRQI